MPEMLQNSEGSRSPSEKEVGERRSPEFPLHYTTVSKSKTHKNTPKINGTPKTQLTKCFPGYAPASY